MLSYNKHVLTNMHGINIKVKITLLSRDACTGTQTDPAQRDNQGAGSKTELGNGRTTQIPHEDAGRPQRTDRREQQQQQPQQSEFHGRGVRQDACRSDQQGVRI